MIKKLWFGISIILLGIGVIIMSIISYFIDIELLVMFTCYLVCCFIGLFILFLGISDIQQQLKKKENKE